MLFSRRNVIILGLVLAIEMVLAPFTGQGFDMMVWLRTGELMASGVNIYLPNDHFGYLPLWPYWTWLSHYAYLWSNHSYWLWSLVVKLPLIGAHLLLALFLGRLASNLYSKRKGEMVFNNVLLFGFLIYSGAIWGQLNVLTALFTVLALGDAVYGKPWRSGFWLGVGSSVKPIAALAFFALSIFHYRNHGMGGFLKFACMASIIPLLVSSTTLGFFGWWEYPFLLTLYFQFFSLQCEGCVAPQPLMNIWSGAGTMIVPLGDLWFIPWVWIFSLALVSYLWSRKPSMNTEELFCSTGQIYLVFMATFPRLPETAVTDILPILLLISLSRGRRYVSLAIILQVLAMAFSLSNHGLYIFDPIWERISPNLIQGLEESYKVNWPINTIVKAVTGSLISIISVFFTINLLRRKGFEIRRTSGSNQ